MRGREGRAGGMGDSWGCWEPWARGHGVLEAASPSWDALSVMDRAGCGENPIFAEMGSHLWEFESYRTWKSSEAIATLVP